DINHVQIGIERNRVPWCATTAVDPPFACWIPGLRRGFHRSVLERLRWIPGHGEPAPESIARLAVICGDIAAHTVLGAALADHDLAVEHTRRAGDRVGMLMVDQRVLFPDLGAGRGIERDQAPIICGHEYLALVEGEATADRVAATPIGL